MNRNAQQFECIVIGAGISGLMSTTVLKSAGVRVKVLEKARGVGGRMTTRRIEEYRFDHGARRIPGGSGQWANHLKRWLDELIITECNRDAFVAFDCPDEKRHWFCCPGGLTTLPRHLAGDLDVEKGCRVTEMTCLDGIWRLVIDDAREFTAKAVILTPPVPQVLDIIRKERKLLQSCEVSCLSNASYNRCLALMVAFDDPVEGLSEYAPSRESPIAGVVDNYVKGVSGKPGALTVYATSEFSESHFDLPDNVLTGLLLEPLSAKAPAVTRLQRWRYSQVTRGLTESHVLMTEPAPIGFAGDAFGTGNIDGAAASGIAVARAMVGLLTA